MTEDTAIPPHNTTTYLVRTPRGRTTTVDNISPNASYESFLHSILLRCQKHDHGGHDDRQHRSSSPLLPNILSLCHKKASELSFIVYNGKILNNITYKQIIPPKPTPPTPSQSPPPYYHLSLHLRLLGGMTDRQNRVGSKFGGGGVSSSQNAERERKERLRQLALESVDLAKDPYLMRNHLGTYECKLCLTLHTNEGNYLAHTQGKKHQAGLARRAAMEARLTPQGPVGVGSGGGGRVAVVVQPRVRIGRPGYEVSKSRDVDTNQRCLSFELHYPELDEDSRVQPRHRFMSAYEQRVESPPDRRFQYLLIACDPYETVGFKIPNEPVDRSEGKFVTNWDAVEKKFTLTLYFLDDDTEEEKK